MPRVRVRRGRLAALALLSLGLLTATTTVALTEPSSAQTTSEPARMSASKPVVQIGKRAVLRGRFAGSPNAPVQLQRKAPGTDRWRNAKRTRTGSGGWYRVRIAPRRTWQWRALLMPVDAVQTSDGADAERRALREGGPARVKVRSRTRARTVRRHVIAGKRTRITGRVRPRGARKVVIRAAGQRETTRSGPKGRFATKLRVPSTGVHKVRVRAAGDRRALGSKTRAGRVTAYRPVGASYYGPGFYGRRTACGQTLTTSTQGTAHRTLPCGTKLRLRHRGRTVTVRVIDRGPYVAGRELDLTYATKQRLGFGSTGTVLMSR